MFWIGQFFIWRCTFFFFENPLPPYFSLVLRAVLRSIDRMTKSRDITVHVKTWNLSFACISAFQLFQLHLIACKAPDICCDLAERQNWCHRERKQNKLGTRSLHKNVYSWYVREMLLLKDKQKAFIGAHRWFSQSRALLLITKPSKPPLVSCFISYPDVHKVKSRKQLPHLASCAAYSFLALTPQLNGNEEIKGSGYFFI